MEKPDSPLLFKQPMYADKKQWKQFLSTFLLVTGVGLTVAGIIFFFVYNWENLPKFAKPGIVQTLLVAPVLLTALTRQNILTKQIVPTGATFLVGTLFAVFGQIYQTGADAYDLFLGWILFTILWMVAVRFTPFWLTFTGLLCITIWLYVMQIVPDSQWAVILLTSAVAWTCASATVITEWTSIKGILNRQNRWFVSLLSLTTIVHVIYLMMVVIYEKDATVSTPFTSTALLSLAELWFGWRQRNLFYLSAIPFAILMILLSLLICRSNLRDINTFLLSRIIVITGTTLLIYVTLHLKKQWYGTEE